MSAWANCILMSNALGFHADTGPAVTFKQRLFISIPILCWEISLACSFIMLHLIFNFFDLLIGSHKLLLRCLTTHFLSLHQLTAVTCIYPTRSNNKTQFGKVPSLYTFCQKSYTSCCTLRTPCLAAVELLWYSLGPCVYCHFALLYICLTKTWKISVIS